MTTGSRLRRAFTVALIAAAVVPVRAAERPWRMIRGKSVIVIGQQSPRTLRDIAVEIEQFRMALGGIIRGAQQPLSVPTLVMTFDDYESLKPVVPLYKGKPATVGGFCHCGGGDDDFSVIAASLAGYEQSSAVIFHEYTHFLVRSSTARMPIWLNEGLAEYFSTFSLQAGDREAIIGGVIARHIRLLRGQFIPLAQLLTVGHDSPLYNESDRQSIFYAEAWALTHYLLIARPGGDKAVNAYLESKDATPDALAAAVGMTLPELERELRLYVKRPTFQKFKYTLAQRIDVDAPEQARTLDPAEAAARLGELQVRVRRVDEAAPRIEAAAKAGPDVAEAHVALAILRAAQKRDAEMLAPLEKAVALAPGDFFAQYLYALTVMRHASGLDRQAAQATYERAHGALTKALAVNPDSAAALAWDAWVDSRLNVRWDEAREQTKRAIRLAPGRIDYQLQLAVIYLRDPETRAAGRALVAALAAQSANESVAAQARAMLARIDESGRSAGPAGTVAEVPDSGARILKLRTVQSGEQRALGELVVVDCNASGVRFHVRADGRDLTASAARMEDVDFVSFLEDKTFAMTCGPHLSPERVYLTWRTDAKGAPIAVAVEFLPKSYVP